MKLILPLISACTLVLSLSIPTSPYYLAQQKALTIPQWVGKFWNSVFLSEASNEAIMRADFGSWLDQQRNISFQGILNNIGGVSSLLDPKEVYDGVVIASPSKYMPNYFYQWTRDAALTIKSLIDYLDDTRVSSDVAEVQKTVEDYISNNYILQRLDNPSGTFGDDDKSGLGEPKFHPNNTAFEENWGRPQRDGPGLRVTTICAYLELIDKYQVPFIHLKSGKDVYTEIVKPDLVYIIKNWNRNGFDLWEEINAQHFFTSLTQLRALIDGSKLAKKYEPQDSGFIEELKNTFNDVRKYVEWEGGFIKSNVPYVIETPSLLSLGKRSGLNIASLLASLHTHDLASKDYDNIPYDVDHNLVLSTLRLLITDMKFRYPINRKHIGVNNVGVALGRYPEDIYDGYGTSEGNPWFISTATASELILRLIYKLETGRMNIVIDELNSDFFKQFVDYLEAGQTIVYGSLDYLELIDQLIKYSDSFLQIVKDHVDNEGHISEQFNRYHGFMQGATDLTWSYSAVWNALRWREKVFRLLNPSKL
ncbi:uncharacterized protein KQ657_004515 [Scheffersomyces spartinae]|uniref:glucan 1,4-alpha-glucosidase n=1 Tax=Scheffersomyces spartinae TaxID=45513 RepID=A0A9P7VAD2_9ASCO|nr:uncharacterized protein KQ657_004515 [Scheffersomyces spartinae]KAG7194303.1 hypothetical protein KQ657_004515 [Scheffersomyces spartinae]